MGKRIKYLIIATFSLIFLTMITMTAQVIMHHNAVQKHHFKYQLGEKVKVKDVTCFVTRHTLTEDLFSYNEEIYTVVIENTNATMIVKTEEINK